MTAKKRKPQPRKTLNFQTLESRRLLAGIFYDAPANDLIVFGDSGNNVGSVTQLNSSTLRAEIDGQTQDVSINGVDRVVFVGFGGDDEFSNSTAIDGALFGHDGNDQLTGGSGDDTVVGGAGNDVLHGGAGDDTIRGALGNDQAFGGSGNDRIFGDAGQNQLSGQAGDDIVYGGGEDDTIFGGDGIDQLFGLAGNDVIDTGAGGVAFSAGIGQADLALGLDGDDTLIGGGGLDVLYGGNGADQLTGGEGENRLHGQNGNDLLSGGGQQDFLAGNNDDDIIFGNGGIDFIFGGAGADVLHGGDGNDRLDGNLGDDVLNGEAGDDFLTGWLHDDVLNGGNGFDTAIYSRNFAEFSIAGETDALIIQDGSGFAGTDEVNFVESLQFGDGLQDAVIPERAERVFIQPIIVSNDDGSNTAEFFGTTSQETEIKSRIDTIFAQADVDIEFLAEVHWNNTQANVGSGSGSRPTRDLDWIVETGDEFGVGSSDALVLDVYFVEVAAGFANTTENTANGLAYVDFNGISIHIGDNLPQFDLGRQTIAEVTAHEIAHNLGLEHIEMENNLLAQGDELLPFQVITILDSEFSQPIN